MGVVQECGAGECGSEGCRAAVVQGAWCAGEWSSVLVQYAGAVQTNVVHAKFNVVQPYIDGGWCMRVCFRVVQYQGPH